MLSGIFEKTGNRTKIEKRLFILSILFLCSAFSIILFIGLKSIFKDAKIDNSWGQQIWIYITAITYFLGIFLFFAGFAYIIIVLIQHYKQILMPPY
jgi:preprotein translocase subunit SecG